MTPPTEIELEEKTYLIKLADGRTVMIQNGVHLNIDTYAGDIHVVEQGNETRVSMYDHFTLTITGTAKRVPTITLDSDEYPTNLVIRQTEAPWQSFRDERNGTGIRPGQQTPADVTLAQMKTAVTNMGELMATYYASLRNNGVPKVLAFEMVVDYQRYTLSMLDTDG